jgi:hypothetical protein
MIEPITITLEDKTYTIRQLTIGQDMDLQIGLMLPQNPDPQENVRCGFERNIAIIVAALSADYPEITRNAILQMRVTPEERVAAVDRILDFAGFVKITKAKPGEAAAGEAPAAPAAA